MLYVKNKGGKELQMEAYEYANNIVICRKLLELAEDSSLIDYTYNSDEFYAMSNVGL